MSERKSQCQLDYWEDCPLKKQLDRLEDGQKLITQLLTGNGTPSAGIIVRMDRLEQAEKKRDWYVRTAMTASIGAIATWLWTLIKGG